MARTFCRTVLAPRSVQQVPVGRVVSYTNGKAAMEWLEYVGTEGSRAINPIQPLGTTSCVVKRPRTWTMFGFSTVGDTPKGQGYCEHDDQGNFHLVERWWYISGFLGNPGTQQSYRYYHMFLDPVFVVASACRAKLNIHGGFSPTETSKRSYREKSKLNYDLPSPLWKRK